LNIEWNEGFQTVPSTYRDNNWLFKNKLLKMCRWVELNRDLGGSRSDVVKSAVIGAGHRRSRSSE